MLVGLVGVVGGFVQVFVTAGTSLARRMSSKRMAAYDALKQLRENREFGLKHSEMNSDSEDEDMYEYVSDKEYEKRQKRLKEEGDFVVEDDGTGYKDKYNDRDGGNDISALKRKLLGGGGADKTSSKKKKNTDEQGKSHQLATMFSKVASSKTHNRKDVVGPNSSSSSSFASRPGAGLGLGEKEAEKALQDASLETELKELYKVAREDRGANSGSKRKSSKKASKSERREKRKQKKLRKESGVSAKSRFSDSEEEREAAKSERKRGADATAAAQSGGDDEDEAPMMFDDDDNDESNKQDRDENDKDDDAAADADVKKEQETDLRAQMLEMARAKPVRAAPKAKVKAEAPATPPANSKEVTFMTTPPTAFGIMEAGEDKSGWTSPTMRPKSSADTVTSGEEPPAESGSGNKPAGLGTDKDGHEYMDFYYMDMYEDYHNNAMRGKAFMFGKIWCPRLRTHVSCSVEVQNIDRVLFFLPREGVEMADLHKEVQSSVIQKVVVPENGRRAHRVREAPRKYAFELPGVPLEETTYLEVRYPMCAEKPFDRLAHDACGQTYSRVFGTQQSATECFVLERQLKGPMWIRMKKLKFPETSKTWCKYHAEVEKPLHVCPLRTELLNEHKLKVAAAQAEVTRCAELEGADIGEQQQAAQAHLEAAEQASIAEPAPPKMRVLSLTIKTCLNEKHQHEVTVISGLIRDNVELTTATPKSDRTDTVKVFTLLRNDMRGKLRLPGDAKELINRTMGQVKVAGNERALLNLLLANFARYDPDVVLGHNTRNFDMPTLLRRMSDVGCQNWSKLGRLKLSKTPKTKADGSFFAGTNPCVGRLLLDSLVTSKELLLGQRSYALTELCRTQLDRPRFEVQPAQVPWFYETKERVAKLVSHNEADAWLTLQLAFKLEALPVTLQLTSLAGNLWSRTLAGGRAERIEYLLLHEFYKERFVVPDKVSNFKKDDNKSKSKSKGKKKNDSGAAGAGDVSGGQGKKRGKPKYGGGLVLEPKKGLYDKYILLLDFNSLYPSIIQEYNICYTTVERKREEVLSEQEALDRHRAAIEEAELNNGENVEVEVDVENGDALPELPDRTVHKDLAILPRLIKGLVDRRRQVKALLKNEENDSKRSQLDVRQKALKITANSMYGCLGFTGFRFFAQPVAALVTSQGRQILASAVQVTQEKLGYEVVYGDTDSIMVNTRTDDLQLVKTAGNNIKREINKLYRLLEIEQDGIFKTLLLLKKKKYAALMVTGERRLPTGETEVLTEKETKGLDLVRRDWCDLSKRVGNKVLDFILSGKSYDDVVDSIHGYLESVSKEIKENKVPLKEYVIVKGLNKNPKDYPDAKSQPHLGVALAMVEGGKPVSTGDSIPYVICTMTRSEWKQKVAAKIAEGGAVAETKKEQEATTGKSSSSYAERAFHPLEIEGDSFSLLKVDTEWYRKQQLVPPTQRLCEPIDGTSPSQIAEALGLDPAQFNTYAHGSNDEDLLNIVDISDAERYKDCNKLIVDCPVCAIKFTFSPGGVALPLDVENTLASTGEPVEKRRAVISTQAENGMHCPQCDWQVDHVWLNNKLTLEARKAVGTYYQSWLVSDDPSVELRTRQQSVLGRSFALGGRRLQLQPEYTATQLYTQLKYIESLTDTDRAIQQLEKANAKRKDQATAIQPPTLPNKERKELDKIKASIHKDYIEHNAYNWVSPDIFKLAFKL